MDSKIFFAGLLNKKEEVKDKEISRDVYYQEKYNEMRRHRDWQLNAANWCTIILLAIIAGFVSLTQGESQIETLFGLCGIVIFKICAVLIIITIVVLGSKIVDHSANRYSHLRKWVSDYLEPSVNGNKYVPEDVGVRIQNVIIAILVILGVLTSFIVIILK